ncbi:outer membrane protein with beta-barrel domain [Cecembia calidifontis]|uniref:Outer membrane protein with beta-barrel domain n=2 Tax=Cecembia calidifontis TaxID=1187080 RepID=A0A4Q7PE66_9BACT|nr:outer membrane protein with beta-barrel domain [Cecembia calidifontis]
MELVLTSPNQLLFLMKKLSLIVLTMIISVSISHAQSSQRDRGGFGVRGGVNFSTFGGGDIAEDDYSQRTGFHAGLYNSFYFGSVIALEPGVYYSVKGTRNNDFVNSRAVLNYVDIPVLLRLHLTEGLNVFGGPQASFLTSSTFEGDLFGSTISFDTDNVRERDFGMVLGIGYNLPKGLNVQGTYNYGLSPVFKNSNVDVFNRGFQISLGYTF